ncbi:hypothetical protein [Nonomuraea sp. NPDC001023]|uniref:hypothetical protein n=1 Tax=Nonomuraea sp. NPDC001023 TaxID=3154770 RepID=UPI00331AC93A
MSLLLWLHIGFAIFTIGPLTAATMAAPRAIRTNNVPVLRNIQRTTRIYSLASLGVLVFGVALGVVVGNGVLGLWYMTASMTLFIVAIVLLVIIDRDQPGQRHGQGGRRVECQDGGEHRHRVAAPGQQRQCRHRDEEEPGHAHGVRAVGGVEEHVTEQVHHAGAAGHEGVVTAPRQFPSIAGPDVPAPGHV